MIYISIALLAGFTILRFLMFIRNRRKMKTMDEIDRQLISLINGQESKK